MDTEDKDNILEKLKKMTHDKDTEAIIDTLNNIPAYIKGRVFEEYLAFLFEGNGYVAAVNGSSWDGGADIILSRKNNPNKIMWIVQAKNTSRPLNNTVIREEFSKFENESSIKYGCRYFMIISLNGYVEKINIFNKTNMSLESFDYLEILINNYSDKEDEDILIPDLRPHNRYTYKEIKAVLAEKNKVAVPNATGTGKSFIILQLLFDYIKNHSIVLAPTNEIIERMKRMAPWSMKRCKFFTYSKFSAMHSKGRLDDVKADLIILDELHRAGALNWGKAVRHVLSINPEAKVVGLSATPIRFLDNNRDMISELLDGASTTPLSLSEAIARRILPSPIYVSAMYNLQKEIDKKMKLMKRYNISTEDRVKYIKEIESYKKRWETDSRIEYILKKHLPDEDNMKFIVFCENNKHLCDMKCEVEGWFNNVLEGKRKVITYTITSQLADNMKELSRFENECGSNELRLLFSISKLNEGIHIKGITGIIMLRNTKSPSIYYQQLGRCLTADSADKKPIVFDFVDNIDNLELMNFRSKLEESIVIHDEYRKSIGVGSDEVRLAFYEEHLELISQLKNIERKITYNWENYYESLIEFKELYNNINVPNTDEYRRLYSWMSLQRTLYNKGILNEEYINKLESIGFIWDQRFYNWKENLKKYDDLICSCYRKKISYCKLISDKYYIDVYENDRDIINSSSLINWMDKQIKEYRTGTLEERKERLLIKTFKTVDGLEENSWLLSLYKIVKFYDFIKEKHGIDCYINKIAPSKTNFINLLSVLYNNEGVIKNTVEKSLPKEGQVINDKYMNDESWNKGFVISLLKSEEASSILEEYIDDINIIYFQDLIDSNEKFMERWYNYNNSSSNLDIIKLKLLKRGNFTSNECY